MNLAAMLDLGIAPDFLRQELSKLGLDDEFELRVSADSRKGICGSKVDVLLTHHRHEHRNLSDIEELFNNSRLNEQTKETSLSIFRQLAEAEAKVHGKGVYDIHFHEVGAIDAIVDIAGAAICYHQLGVDAVWCSPVELGGGVVRCAHGSMPVPAPATAELLTGCPTSRGAEKQEQTTPTGAAILRSLVNNFTETPQMVVQKTGYGIGHRDARIPNVLRVHVATVQEMAAFEVSQARLLQCNIDDMTGEMLGAVMDALMEAGALDVHFTPAQMKKNRPSTTLSLLCSPGEQDRFRKLIFRHTTTLGVKSIPVEKAVLSTMKETLQTPLGAVTMKSALLDGKIVHSKPEYEDCLRIAGEHDMPLLEVYRQIGKHFPRNFTPSA